MRSALRTSQRTASDYSHFMFRNASRLVFVAVSVRLLVLRTSQRFASPPTSRSVDPVGLFDGCTILVSTCSVIGFPLRGAYATRSWRCARRDARRSSVHACAGGFLADRFIARNAANVARRARGPLAERHSGAARDECGAQMDAQRLSGAARCEVRSTSRRTQSVAQRAAQAVPAGSDDLTRNAESTTPEGEAEGTQGSIHGRGHTTGRTTIPAAKPHCGHSAFRAGTCPGRRS